MPSTYEEQNLPVPWPFQKLLVSATLTSDPEKLCSLDLYAPRLFKCVGMYQPTQPLHRFSCLAPSRPYYSLGF